MSPKLCEIGGILQYNMKNNTNKGYGFKIVFNTSKEAQHYKEMITWIIQDDKYKIINQRRYYDNML